MTPRFARRCRFLVAGIEGKFFVSLGARGAAGKEGDDRVSAISGCLDPMLKILREGAGGVDANEGEIVLKAGTGEGSASVPMATPGKLVRKGGRKRKGIDLGSPTLSVAAGAGSPFTLNTRGNRTPVLTPMTAISLMSEETITERAEGLGLGGNQADSMHSKATRSGKSASLHTARRALVATKRVTLRSLISNSVLNASLKVERIKLVVIPGTVISYSDSPLLRIWLDRLDLGACWYKGVVAGLLDFHEVGIDGMNRSLVAWEPVVETWGFNVSFSVDALAANGPLRTGHTR